MLVKYIDQEVEVDIDPFDWDDFELKELVDNVAVGMFNDQLVEIDRDMYEFMNAPENNQEPWEMGDTHEYIQGGLTYDKEQDFKSFQKKIKEPRSNIDGKRVARIVNNFLKINCPFGKAKNELRKFETENNLNLKLDNFNIFNLNLKNNDVYFSTNTGRNVEYYTGLVFEILKKSKNLNLASGGRYDNLMQTLGSIKKIPAIGGAINYDNLLKL